MHPMISVAQGRKSELHEAYANGSGIPGFGMV
jgi:hypothetical protein